MTLSPDQVRLLHVRDATQSTSRFIAGRERKDLETPRNAWDDAARMRARLVHHYFDIDLDVLWATVTVDLPAVLAAVGP